MKPTVSGGGLLAALQAIPTRVPVERIDRIWVFPPKELGDGRETGLVVLALRPAEEESPPESNLLMTVEYELPRSSGPPAPTISFIEQGWAPPERLARVISGVVGRLDDPDDPAEHWVGGDEEGWADVLASYATDVDPAKGE